MLCWWVSWTPPPLRLPAFPPLHTTMFPCIALVMPFSRDTLTELNMTLVRLSGAKSLQDTLVSQLLGEWVASSPLARARWSEATEVVFTDAWKELVTPLDLRPPVSIPDPPAIGCSWPLPSWARYVQSRPSLVDTIDWTRPLTFIVRGDAYPCAGGGWTQLSIGLLNHGARGRTPAYLWVIGMAVCRDGDMAALATI